MTSYFRNINSIITRTITFLVLAFLFVEPMAVNAQKKSKEEQDISREYVSRAEGLAASNAWDAAKQVIDEGLSYYPDDPDLRYLNGQYYYYAENDLPQSRYNLVKAIQESDHHYQARRLLVDVEEDSKHYSSAICYINELLEYEPYDRTLWRRKISLYNKIGHTEEADEALKRLARIYPNDSIIRNELSLRNHENWSVNGTQKSSIDKVRELEILIDMDPHIDYFIDLVDTYYKLGESEKALGTAMRGLEVYPKNPELAKRAASIMAEMGQYSRALGLLRRTGLSQLYGELLREAAADARARDPYEASARLYEQTHEFDALNYLINTSITRGYYSDAHDWLNEGYKMHMDTTTLLMKEYALEKRFGTEKTLLNVLERLANRDILGEEHRDDYAEIMLEIANRDIANGEWKEADTHLQKALSILRPDSESWPAAIARRITVLGRMNRMDEARELYKKSLAHAAVYDEVPTELYQERFLSAYEEIAAARLKQLIDEENYDQALLEAEELLNLSPRSEAALRTAINMSQTLGKKEKFYHYAALGYEYFPDVPYFIVKQAIALEEQGKIEEALALLAPREGENEYVNQQLIAANSGLSTEYAGSLLKSKHPELAMTVIDQALKFDGQNKELLYLKGLAYEQLKQFGLAYDYQKRYYNPTNAEQSDWYEQMRYLRFRGYKNRLDATFSNAFYDSRGEDMASIAHLYALASVSYSRLTEKNTYTGQISYKGIDGNHTPYENTSGGMGLEFLAQWDHTFNARWSGMANLSYGTRFFNKIGANISASYSADHAWDFSLKLGYRRTAKTYLYFGGDDDYQVDYNSYNLFLLRPQAQKTWDRIVTSLGCDLILLQKSLYYNLSWKGKLFINEDNISSVALMVGYGSFPELTFFDQSALRNISHSNAMVGGEFMYLLTGNFYIGLTGTWNTFYNPRRLEDGSLLSSYRNVFAVDLSLHLAF